MSTIERLRPDPKNVDPDWSARALFAIMTESSPPRDKGVKSKVAVAVGGSVVAVLAGGGVAFAAGMTPPWVHEEVNHLSALNDGRFDTADMARVADFQTPAGSNFTVWAGENSAGGRCLATATNANQQSVEAPATAVVACGGAGALEPSTFVHDEGTMVYGVSPVANASNVEMRSGDQSLATLPIDPETHGYGAGLPQARDIDEVKAIYRDANGTVVGNEVLTAAP